MTRFSERRANENWTLLVFDVKHTKRDTFKIAFPQEFCRRPSRVYKLLLLLFFFFCEGFSKVSKTICTAISTNKVPRIFNNGYSRRPPPHAPFKNDDIPPHKTYWTPLHKRRKIVYLNDRHSARFCTCRTAGYVFLLKPIQTFRMNVRRIRNETCDLHSRVMSLFPGEHNYRGVSRSIDIPIQVSTGKVWFRFTSCYILLYYYLFVIVCVRVVTNLRTILPCILCILVLTIPSIQYYKMRRMNNNNNNNSNDNIF